jgi:hypothetical protein
MAAESAYYNGSIFFDPKQLWPTLSYLVHPERNLGIYALMFIVFYISTFGYRRGEIDLTASLNEAADVLLRTQWPVLVVTIALMAAHLSLLDPAILWSNSRYMLLRGPDAMSIGAGPASFIQTLFQLVAMVATLYAGIATARGRIVSMLLWIAPATWGLIFFFVDASRTALVLFAEFFVVLIFLASGIRRWIYAIMAVAGGLFVLSACLAGRAGGYFGLMSLPQIASSAFSGTISLNMMIGNLFEGVFITGDSLDISARFDSRYALFSFSPLPSLIDGFDALRERHQIRLFAYVPMSGIAEAVKFGPAYFAALMFFYWLACWTVSRGARRLGPFYLLITFGIVNTFIIAGAYPVRNVFRQLLIWLTLALLIPLGQSIWQRAFGGRARRVPGLPVPNGADQYPARPV